VRFFLVICKTSDVVLLFYTTSEVYTKFGMVSIQQRPPVIGGRCNFQLFFHYFQHHPGTQLKAVLENQAVCDGLMLSHTIGVFLK
ncbi:hypothetical protein SAMN02910435_02575, partial [Ruminococcaceae bacterium D5]